MKLSLEPITQMGCQIAKDWRNAALETLRTPFPLTDRQQEEFRISLSDRNSPHKYWEVTNNDEDRPRDYYPMVGFAGLTNVDYINGHAEISLIISPKHRGTGIGSMSVDLILGEAFNRMRLHQVYGEVYFPNPAIEFWRKVVSKYHGYSTELPDRKFTRGQHWNSLYFAIFRDHFPKP